MGWLGVAFGFGLSFGVVIYMFGAPPPACCLESACWRRLQKAAPGQRRVPRVHPADRSWVEQMGRMSSCWPCERAHCRGQSRPCRSALLCRLHLGTPQPGLVPCLMDHWQGGLRTIHIDDQLRASALRGRMLRLEASRPQQAHRPTALLQRSPGNPWVSCAVLVGCGPPQPHTPRPVPPCSALFHPLPRALRI